MPQPNQTAPVEEDRLIAIIDRIDRIVDMETTCLKSDDGARHHAFVEQKSRGLLELSRYLINHQPMVASPATAARVRAFRSALDVNSRALHAKLAALQLVSSILSRAFEEATTDGTYGSRPSHRVSHA